MATIANQYVRDGTERRRFHYDAKIFDAWHARC